MERIVADHREERGRPKEVGTIALPAVVKGLREVWRFDQEAKRIVQCGIGV
jgi:hypothetical protein